LFAHAASNPDHLRTRPRATQQRPDNCNYTFSRKIYYSSFLQHATSTPPGIRKFTRKIMDQSGGHSVQPARASRLDRAMEKLGRKWQSWKAAVSSSLISIMYIEIDITLTIVHRILSMKTQWMRKLFLDINTNR
jgi:hypothetical protein